MTKGCKQCREKKAAYMKSYRKKKAATKASKPRSKPKHQLAANDPTPDLLAKPSPTTDASRTNAQKIDEEMQHSSKAIKLLDQDEINAAADRLLDLIIDLQDSDDSEDEEEHRTCED